MSFFDALGWAGAVMILGAYGLLTLGRWDAASLRYQVTNTVGAVALLVWAFSIAAWQSALINAVWGVYRSDDGGVTWRRINDDKHQFGGIGPIAADHNIAGRLYVGGGGRGVLFNH